MNVGIVCPFKITPVSSGAARRVLEIARGLHFHGLSVYVLHAGPSATFYENFRLMRFNYFETSHLIRNFKWAHALDVYLHPLNLPLLSVLHKMTKSYKIDILQGEQPWSVFPSMIIAKRATIPFILDEHNVECNAPNFASRTRALAPYVVAIEKFAICRSDAIMTTSNEDKKSIMSIYNVPEEKIFIAPNGVDAKKFSTLSYSDSRKILGFPHSKKVVFFHGDLGWRPNLEAAETILEFIASRVPNAMFLIIGKNAPISLRIKAEGVKNVQVLGYVPDFENYIGAADACIVPLRSGSGTRLKVIEYLAAGKPLVTTAKGCEGIGLQHDVHAKVCEEVNDCFIDSLKELLSDEKLANEMGSASMEYAKRFDWNFVTKGIIDIYSKILDEKSQ